MENTYTTYPGTIALVRANLKTAITCALIFFIIQLIGIFHHEPWTDEFQSFQIAMNSHSLSNLFFNRRYEGHPALWHLILFVITRFTSNIIAMQVVHIIIATASIFLLFLYSPFTLIEKIIIGFGYYVFYEYAQISRCYVLGVFSIISICCILGVSYYQNKSSVQQALKPLTFIWISLLLFLLANSSLYGLLMSGGLTFYIILILWDERTTIYSDSKLRKAIVWSVLIILLGWSISIFMIVPPPGNFVNTAFPPGFDLSFLTSVLQQPLMAYFPIPYSTDLGSWCSSIFYHFNTPFNSFLSIFFILMIALAFLKKARIFFLYFVFLFIIGAFLLYLPHYWVSPRYYGHFFIALFICFWLERYTTANQNLVSTIFQMMYKSTSTSYLNFISKVNRSLDALRKTVFYLIITIQACVGIYFYCLDFNYPFSKIVVAGEFIVKNHLGRYPFIGGNDAWVLPFSYYTRQPIFTFERGDTSSFEIYDNKKRIYFSPNEFTDDIVNVVNNSKTDTAVLCLSDSLEAGNASGEIVALGQGDIKKYYHFKYLNKINTPTIHAEGNFYFFLIWKK